MRTIQTIIRGAIIILVDFIASLTGLLGKFRPVYTLTKYDHKKYAAFMMYGSDLVLVDRE